ncbi:MAG: hypothetical protein WAO76_11040 [Georgfuchsia sp.]
MQSTKEITHPPYILFEDEDRDPSQPEHPALLNRTDLYELGELIGTIWLASYTPSPEVDQIIAGANRSGNSFTARLAVRALRLEQALIEAQERIIRLEWQLAQIKKCRNKG